MYHSVNRMINQWSRYTLYCVTNELKTVCKHSEKEKLECNSYGLTEYRFFVLYIHTSSNTYKKKKNTLLKLHNIKYNSFDVLLLYWGKRFNS